MLLYITPSECDDGSFLGFKIHCVEGGFDSINDIYRSLKVSVVASVMII